MWQVGSFCSFTARISHALFPSPTEYLTEAGCYSVGGVGIFPPSGDGLWLHFVPRDCMNAEVNEESNVRNSVTFLSSVSLQNVPSPLDR